MHLCGWCIFSTYVLEYFLCIYFLYVLVKHGVEGNK